MGGYSVLAFSVTECAATLSPLACSTHSQKRDRKAADRLL